MSKIIGNTTATPTPRSDWAQTDPSKADFILNKPENISGVYVGSGDMPDGYNIQIDPEGIVYDISDINGGDSASVAEHNTDTEAHADIREIMSTLSADKADKAYVISVFEELKTLITNMDTAGALAVLDNAILDLSILA